MSDESKPERPLLWVSFRVRGAEIVVKTVDELYLEKIFTAICEAEVPIIERGPEVILLEAIRKPAEAEGKFIRQVGGLGNYGHVKIRLEPADIDAGFQFVNGIQTEALPSRYMAPIKQGLLEAARGGVLRGFEIAGVRATLIGGSYHETDSNEMAFRIAASMAFQEAARKASPVLLEPMMEVELIVLEALVGEVIGDINSRRGRVESIEQHVGMSEIRAVVPLRETLRSSRLGRPDYPLRFLRYEPVTGFSEGRGEDGTGLGVRKPRRPSSGRASTAAELKFDSE